MRHKLQEKQYMVQWERTKNFSIVKVTQILTWFQDLIRKHQGAHPLQRQVWQPASQGGRRAVGLLAHPTKPGLLETGASK